MFFGFNMYPFSVLRSGNRQIRTPFFVSNFNGGVAIFYFYFNF